MLEFWLDQCTIFQGSYIIDLYIAFALALFLKIDSPCELLKGFFISLEEEVSFPEVR